MDVYHKAGVIENLTRPLELPLLVRSAAFFLSICLNWGLKRDPFTVFSPFDPKRENLDVLLASFSIIPVFTVCDDGPSVTSGSAIEGL